MKRASQRNGPLSAILIAIVLVACSMSGLAAGIFARHLGTAVAAGTSKPPVSSHLTATPRSTATPAPAPTATLPSQPSSTTGFVLSASASPTALSPGQSFVVTVTAVTGQGGVPISGLQCFMRAPTKAHPPLLQSWPPPKVTDTSGQATWNLIVPQVSPGLYGVEVVAYGTNSYTYYVDALMTISG